MKKFSKRFLKEVLGFNEEDVKLTMECQRKFPTILLNDGEGCCVDSRKIWEELEVSKQFSHWIKQQIEDLDLKEEKEYDIVFKGYVDLTQEDIKNMNQQQRSRRGIVTEYLITIEIAKEIAMVAGAKGGRTGKELKKNSKMCRKYFILMEKAIKGIQEHEKIREPEKQTYNKMKKVIIDDYSKKHDKVTKYDIDYLMKRECSLINQSLMGLDAYEIKNKLGYMDIQTREHLQIKHNKAIDFLQNMIIGLVTAGVEFKERSKIIENICKSQYSDLRMDN
ncbi:TPA: antA/AntB antirepressor family protein [Clostridium botulinum]|nr:antA/AntB antirepressor family protein [Clostridium botulinum]HCL4454987.1 antA/AntB antirepressor family protein [Clostridium botulinum]